MPVILDQIQPEIQARPSNLSSSNALNLPENTRSWEDCKTVVSRIYCHSAKHIQTPSKLHVFCLIKARLFVDLFNED